MESAVNKAKKWVIYIGALLLSQEGHCVGLEGLLQEGHFLDLLSSPASTIGIAFITNCYQSKQPNYNFTLKK